VSDGAVSGEKLMRLRFDGVCREGAAKQRPVRLDEAEEPVDRHCLASRGVEVLCPKKLYPKLTANGRVGTKTVIELHRALASALPQA
jgi:hypothetical protein